MHIMNIRTLSIKSDLHIEFSEFKPHVDTNNVDAIVLAGDIWKGDRGIYWARGQWPNKPIIYVAGNHEYYGKVRGQVLSSLRIAAKVNNVHFLENDEVILDGIRFLGCTLWTDFKLFGEAHKLRCMQEAVSGLNDFRVIHEGDRIYSPTDALALFEESYAFLKRKLIDEKFKGKTVVITHHLPSMLSVAERFKNDPISACFASNLDHLFGHSDLWIHGHTHDSFDYTVRGTRVICNPRGYSKFDKDVENFNFKPNLIVEI